MFPIGFALSAVALHNDHIDLLHKVGSEGVELYKSIKLALFLAIKYFNR